MIKVAVIGLGILVWVLMAVLLALFVARTISLRDRQRSGRTEPCAPAKDESDDGAQAFHPRSRRRPRSKM
jgi:hypothetical protein